MKKWKKVVLAIIAVTLYCNIGWGIGSYYLYQIFPAKHSELSLVGKIAAGGWNVFAQGDITQNEGVRSVAIIVVFGVLWPLGLTCIVTIWIVYFAYYASWFIFAGGGAKLLGLA